MQIPHGLGPYHIIGIGGIGMSAIAEILLSQNIAVQGSDLNENANVKRLRQQGATVFVGHAAENLRNARYVVISTAVKRGNPELEEAIRLGLPVIRRAEMLAELMRTYATISVTGTHGKTTTTSLIATLLEHGGLDPTVINGGIVNDWGSNARIGKSNWMVVEADESDGTFAVLPSQIGVITNMDPEHLDYYGSYEKMKAAFARFMTQIPYYGLLVACHDHKGVQEVLREAMKDRYGRRILSYGESGGADVQLVNLRAFGGAMMFDVHLGPKTKGGQRRIRDISIPIPGRYNAINALAAVAVASELGLSDDTIREALAAFGGVKRRFTKTGSFNGADFYDDYAHHPVEIAEVLKAARAITHGRLICILQPHRYSRLQNLFDEFVTCVDEADIVLAAPVFEAGEAPIPDVNHRVLADKIKARGKAEVVTMDGEATVRLFMEKTVKPGDLVIGVGAGTISAWMNALPKYLNAKSRHNQSPQKTPA